MRATQVLVICIAALFLLPGCMPLQQSYVTGGEGYDHFSYHDYNDWGLLQIGPSNQPKTISIVDAESFAIGPRGKRYGVESEPHPYDLREDKDPRVPYVRDRIYLIDAKGKRLGRWRNGGWQFTFVFDAPDGRESRHFNMTLWTFFYNPVIHGPPN
jgi:hypothetical protein